MYISDADMGTDSLIYGLKIYFGVCRWQLLRTCARCHAVGSSHTFHYIYCKITQGTALPDSNRHWDLKLGRAGNGR